MSELLNQDREALRDAIDAALPDESFAKLKKKAQDLAEQISEEIEWNLRDNLASNLAYHVKEMAGRAVNALLEGNESEMIRWLSCDANGFTGRSDGYGTRTIDQQHPVIHGKLFEQGCVLLRKRIAEAHRDLIQNERIKDLEDQVASLVAQNNKLERERNEWREKALAYS
jgi:outer membrane murein-binding lipoprotein Lpp